MLCFPRTWQILATALLFGPIPAPAPCCAEEQPARPGGEKIFWSRGNGWVLAGLARLLQFMPGGYPAGPRFLQQFREMADKLLSLQQPDGSWHPSLLSASAPDLAEASGTGFFTYALAWGVNRGHLDRAKFEPAVWKGLTALSFFVESDGRLAHTQPGGDRPVPFDPHNNDSFGAGAFLLADYAGGSWSKGDFPTQSSWEKYVQDFSARLRSPLSIALAPRQVD